MRSTTRRAFWGVTRTYRACALASIAVPCSLLGVRPGAALRQRRRPFRSSFSWPRNVRVGANSPSLWPIMASVTNTGTCLRPSWTARVCPSISGMIMERRDQVRMTFLVPLSFCVSTFFRRWSSTKGPFFRLRGIRHELPSVRTKGSSADSGCEAWSEGSSALLAGAAAADDHLVARLVRATGAALGLAPGAHRVAAAGGLALTATMGVVDRVHRHAADGRALALPPHAAGLAPVDVGLLGVADLADGRAAARIHVADLARGQTQLGEVAILGDQAHGCTGRTRHLRAATGAELDRMDDRTRGDVLQ